MGICAGVWVCGHVYIGVCIATHICWQPCLSASTCVWIYSPTDCKYLISSFFLCSCMFVYACILLGDFGVWSTQSMNKWKALAVGTEVFAKSKDPSSPWTHPAVLLSLSLSRDLNTSNTQPQHISQDSKGWTRGRREEKDGEIRGVERRGEFICEEGGTSLLRDGSIKSTSPFN